MTAGTAETRSPARLVARIDRLPRHAVRWAATGILGLALFVVFYCNFDINVSFIQTCTQIKAGCTPENAGTAERWPVCLYLAGYLVGGLVIAPVSDRLGRRLLVAGGLVFAVVGSALTALAQDFPTFVTGRGVTGIAMGALLAVANTYIGELAPATARARYTAVTFVLCTVGAMVGIGLGLLLTTESASFPHGLPVALADEGFDSGWRWMYWIAAAIGALALLASLRLPESPRWLIEHGHLDRADATVARLEQRAARRGPLPEPDVAAATPPVAEESTGRAYRELFTHARYRRRTLLLVAMWFFGYATVFAYSTSSTSILTALHFEPPVAGMISAVGGLGFFVQGLFSARWSERLERRYWLPVGAVLTLAGGVVIAELGTHIAWAFVGSFVVFFGFNVWVPPTFALSAESFPTRVRSAGFGLVDGLGVSGGAVGVLVIAPLVPQLSPLAALVLVSAFLIVAAVIGQFAPRGRDRSLEVLSP
ncbi:Predicted arabinose efflux permease, MFS family [Jatrophihabitans endophyticus]|uniref:Predicted arabinose efflux permease, MFS family n=1 Tax=Jatrophihabitans endophyticus TaxID=1206085 RepID=A0A1M5ELK2_9ACTN|nr:MFS transporter [Jatrophihabitans endophyticus]SHF80066.1 Predicted arabinose efflux permease, MFS family [Jatrophihabitans endophyticus]